MTAPWCECGHSEDDHKYYSQTVTTDGLDEVEERWECRYRSGDRHCHCHVTWSEHADWSNANG